jgi:peptidoglycan/LPS O-acetylase OafA/YrhL
LNQFKVDPFSGLIAGVSIDTPSLARIPIGALAFGVSVALSTLSWRYFERPIIRWTKKRSAEPSLAAANALGPG